ncbi:MAG: molybdopterin molybdotransferase MoeA [Terriglobia bacterium]|jgi:molybdopterin molybdotransferase|nr:molybdopterin molybdotransferase MoeA [Terriglobia bacterium]
MQATATAPLTYENAVEVVLQQAANYRPAGSERVPLLEASGRVVATAVRADRDLPPFPRSTRDGFAVRAADCAPGAKLKVIGEIRAGAPLDSAPKNVAVGECVEIMTGASVPKGTDAVLMYEHTRREGNIIVADRTLEKGENIVPSGAEAHAGQEVLSQGTRLNPAGIAVSASVGWASHDVYRRPTVVILPTGDELVEIAAAPGHHQIRNSNSYSLASQIAEAGGEPMLLPVAPDDKARLRELIGEGLQGDLLLLTGGVSVGKYDYVEEILAEYKAQFYFTGVAIQPGKPLVFGDAQAKGRRVPFFGLPGNPVSTMVTFELFVRPVIDALSGMKPRAPRFLQARLKTAVRSKTGLTRFLPGRLLGEGFATEVEFAKWHGSGDVVSTAASNCYIVVPPDREDFPAGQMVNVLIPGVGL